MRVGVVGVGRIGAVVAARLADRAIPGVELVAVTSARLGNAAAVAARIGAPVRAVALTELIESSDVVVECATAAAFPDIARAVVRAGRQLVAISACGLIACPDLADLAVRYGATVTVANGVVPGLDMLRAAAEGTIESVRLTSRLRPGSIAAEPYIVERGVALPGAGEPAAKIFDGTGRGVASAFPRHFNFAVALSLAGIGLDRTGVEVWCDPTVRASVHTVAWEAAEASVATVSRNVLADDGHSNRIVALSVLAALRRLNSPIVFGG